MAASTEALIAAVAATLPLPSPLPSPLTSYSSPLPQIPPPPLPSFMIRLRAELPSTSHPLPLPPPIVLPYTRASMAMMRDAEPSTYCLEPPSGIPSTYYLAPPSRTPPLLPIPLPTSSPPLLLPSTDCRADVLEVTLPPQKRPTRGFKVDYDFVGTIDAKIRRDLDREIDIVMSDSEDSTVTYTTVSSPFESLSDIGSSGVDEPPMMLEDPYAYVPEQAPPLPEFVPEPVYPEFMPPEDDVLPTEHQPLPAAILPTADSPRYIADSDPKEDEEDPEEDPIDYPTNRDDDDDDEEEPSGDEADDEEEDEDDEEEEEEHPALADSIPPPVHCVTARISIRAQTPVSLPSDTEVSRLLAKHTPPPSLLSPWSSPLPQIPSPPLLVSSPVPVSPPPLPASPTYPLGYRAAMIQLRAETPSTSHPLPLPSPIILPHTRASVAMIRVAAPSTYILASRSETPPSGTPPLLPISLPTPSPPLLLPL
ncbi:hypothetical protein Tco_0604451 [Tanacetum coccineum]